MKLLAHYRTVCRRVRKLPLDQYILSLLQGKIKQEFLSGKQLLYSTINAKKLQRHLKVLDSFLVDENYDALESVLDYTFKDPIINQPWAHAFIQEDCMTFKDVWPQIHLIREFADSKSIEEYDQHIRQQSVDADFSLMKYLDLSETRDIPLVRPTVASNGHKTSLESIVKGLQDFHAFLMKSLGTLLKHKIPHFEVIYEPNKFGLPRGHIELHKAYRTKVNGMKQLLWKFRPVQKQHLDHLIAFGNGSGEVNPNFFKYMGAKHRQEAETVSPLVRTYLRKRQLVPNDKAIRDYMKEYAKKQFYVEDDKYVASPLKIIISNAL